MVLAPFLVWTFGVNTFHDASHFAVSRNWLVSITRLIIIMSNISYVIISQVNVMFTYAFPWFSSPVTWYYQHVVGMALWSESHLRFLTRLFVRMQGITRT